MSDAARATESGSVLSPWAPLRIGAYRALWFAQLGSMLGTWMQTVGAQWILVETPDSTALVALVQAASNLPFFLLALPAGALADVVDRRLGDEYDAHEAATVAALALRCVSEGSGMRPSMTEVVRVLQEKTTALISQTIFASPWWSAHRT